MTHLLIASSMLAPFAAEGSFEITDIRRTDAFAGKLGRRVQETLTLKADGKTYTVKLGRKHSRFGATESGYKVGDRVELRNGAWAVVGRDEIR